MLQHSILYDLETDISFFGKYVHIWLQISFPFIQFLIPQIDLSFGNHYLLTFITNLAKDLGTMIPESMSTR
jgi:hypothetical protein